MDVVDNFGSRQVVDKVDRVDRVDKVDNIDAVDNFGSRQWWARTKWVGGGTGGFVCECSREISCDL